MKEMFYGASAFNQDIGIGIMNVTNMQRLFESAATFNQDIGIDTASVTDMGWMFMVLQFLIRYKFGSCFFRCSNDEFILQCCGF